MPDAINRYTMNAFAPPGARSLDEALFPQRELKRSFRMVISNSTGNISFKHARFFDNKSSAIKTKIDAAGDRLHAPQPRPDLNCRLPGKAGE